MTATIVDGREAAAHVRAQVAREVEALVHEIGRAPGLATVLVGDDPASEVYVRNKRRVSAEVGIVDRHQHLGTRSSQQDVAAVIEECNRDPGIREYCSSFPSRTASTGRL